MYAPVRRVVLLEKVVVVHGPERRREHEGMDGLADRQGRECRGGTSANHVAVNGGGRTKVRPANRRGGREGAVRPRVPRAAIRDAAQREPSRQASKWSTPAQPTSISWRKQTDYADWGGIRYKAPQEQQQ